MNAINCKKIEYHIVYGKIKNLYIQVKDGQIIVKAPKYLSKKDIYNILDKKRDWILKKVRRNKKYERGKEIYR